MNIFNKVVIILILVCLIGISLVSVFNEFAGLFKWSDLSLRIFNPNTDIPTYITVLASIGIILISVTLLLLELYRRRVRVASISSLEEGNAMITLETIAVQIRNAVLKKEGLEEIKVKIIHKTAGIIINMFAKLRDDLDVPATMKEIINDASDIVTGKLDIKVLKTNLTIVGFIAGKKEKGEKKEAEIEVMPGQEEGLPEEEKRKGKTDKDK